MSSSVVTKRLPVPVADNTGHSWPAVSQPSPGCETTSPPYQKARLEPAHKNCFIPLLQTCVSITCISLSLEDNIQNAHFQNALCQFKECQIRVFLSYLHWNQLITNYQTNQLISIQLQLFQFYLKKNHLWNYRIQRLQKVQCFNQHLWLRPCENLQVTCQSIRLLPDGVDAEPVQLLQGAFLIAPSVLHH